MTTDELLSTLEKLNLQVAFTSDGRPYLKGPSCPLKDELVRVLRWHREEIIGRLRPPQQEPAEQPAVEQPAPSPEEAFTAEAQPSLFGSETYERPSVTRPLHLPDLDAERHPCPRCGELMDLADRCNSAQCMFDRLSGKIPPLPESLPRVTESKGPKREVS